MEMKGKIKNIQDKKGKLECSEHSLKLVEAKVLPKDLDQASPFSPKRAQSRPSEPNLAQARSF